MRAGLDKPNLNEHILVLLNEAGDTETAGGIVGPEGLSYREGK